MVYAIIYERRSDRTRINTTFISAETETDKAIHRFEHMHKGRLTVIECEPKYKRDKRRTRMPEPKPTGWQLIRVDPTEWIQDESGVHVLINWDEQTASVRLDVMATIGSEPLVSFAGHADNVRKHAMRWFESRVSQKTSDRVSLEHAAYIGAELERANTERIDYVQD